MQKQNEIQQEDKKIRKKKKTQENKKKKTKKIKKKKTKKIKKENQKKKNIKKNFGTFFLILFFLGVSDYLAEDEHHAISICRQLVAHLNYKKEQPFPPEHLKSYIPPPIYDPGEPFPVL